MTDTITQAQAVALAKKVGATDRHCSPGMMLISKQEVQDLCNAAAALAAPPEPQPEPMVTPYITQAHFDKAFPPEPQPVQELCGNTPYDEGPFTLAAPAQPVQSPPLSDDDILTMWKSNHAIAECNLINRDEFAIVARFFEAQIAAREVKP